MCVCVFQILTAGIGMFTAKPLKAHSTKDRICAEHKGLADGN